MRTSGYFNAASHGVPDPAVYERMVRYLHCEAEMGPQHAVQKWATQITGVRALAADLLGGASDDIGFSSTTTTAWMSMVSQMDLAGKRVLVAPHDWGEFHRALMLRGDVTVEVLPELTGQAPDFQAWAARFDDDVAALFVPMVTAIGGLRYPVEAIGALPRPRQMLYVVDAAQALGQMPVGVGQIGCDVLIATARKWLRGPRQTSMAWVKQGAPFSARDLEPADKNAALLLGLGVAIERFLDVGAKQVQAQIAVRSDQLRDWAMAHQIPVMAGTTGSVSLEVGGVERSKVMQALQDANFVGKMIQAQHYEPRALENKGLNILRLSPHLYTTDSDIEGLMRALEIGFEL